LAVDQVQRLLRWTGFAVVTQVLVLLLFAWTLPGLIIGGPLPVVIVACLIVSGQALTWPFIYRIAARFHPLLFPLLSFVLSGLFMLWMINLADDLGIRGVRIRGIGTAVMIVLGFTAGSTLISAIFSLRDLPAYEWFVTRPLRRKYGGTPQDAAPGMLFLEIDGLATPILRRAIDAGYMPTLKRWLDTGSHRLSSWETDLSSQTSASQAGILLGNNHDIPAFRWYDKSAGTVMASSKISTARVLEDQLSTGHGLLATEGASRWNVFSGDAPDSLLTYSTIGDGSRAKSGQYLAYFLNPYTLPRSLTLFGGDIVRERWQAWRQRRRNERPRIQRTLKYAVVRAATTTVMVEASRFMLLADMFRGVPVVYTTFFAYDEVAHHSGIDRPDAFKVLRVIDDTIATLERAASSAARPYHFVVLSDHGQSMGPTFRQQTGMTLAELVTSLVTPGTQVIADLRANEDWAHINLLLNEVAQQDRPSARIVQRTVGKGAGPGDIEVGPTRTDSATGATMSPESDVVVLASGNLGLISFPHWSSRMTYEKILTQFPDLVAGLLENAAIGCLMVQSASGDGLVLGRHGVYYLETDTFTGENPLAGYGAHAAQHLRRTNQFANAPDILVLSAVDEATGAVFAFEELVGSHGGLGGTQVEPFVMYPAGLSFPDEPVIGAEALHRVLKEWVAAIREAAP